MTVSDYIAQRLESMGLDSAFLLSGGGMMYLLDSVSRCGSLHYYCNHHEQACAMAAEGYARQTGKLGVCYATSGPGAANTVTGILGAWQDSSPMIVFTGQSKVSQTIQGSGIAGLRQFGVFEVDIVPIVQSITKYAVMVTDPSTIRYHLEKAIHLALSGRPGPVLLDIPLDIQGARVDPDAMTGFTPEPETAHLSTADGEWIAAALQAAKRPIVLAGHGVRVAGAVDAFLSWVEEAGIPVVTTQLAQDLMPYAHLLYIGHPGPKGDRAGNLALQRADVILCLGSSLHVTTTGFELDQFAPQARKILVDIDHKVLERERVGAERRVHAGIAQTLAGLEGVRLSVESWKETCRHWKRKFEVRLEPHKKVDGEINYYHLIETLSAVLSGGETVVTDAGSAFYVVGQAFKTKPGQRVIVSGALGAMGFALPAAIGAATATEKPKVICLTGDGGLQTNIQELATLKQNGLNVKVVIASNGGYASIRNTQDGFFAGHRAGTDEATGVWIPELSKIAQAYELPYSSCRNEADLAASLKAMLEQEGPAVIEVFTHRSQDVIPTVKSKRNEDGSMTSMPLDRMFPFLPDEEYAEPNLAVNRP